MLERPMHGPKISVSGGLTPQIDGTSLRMCYLEVWATVVQITSLRGTTLF